MSDTPSLSTIAQSIVDRLSPLREVGLIVRRQSNRLRSQGSTTGNGVLTLSLESVTGGESGKSLAGSRQVTNQVWLLRGQLRNLRENDGMETLYDWLMGQLFGWTPLGASGPISLGSFTPQPPVEDYWIVEIRLNIPGILLSQDSTECFELEPVDASLLEAIFTVVEVVDEWGVNSDTAPV